MMELGSPLLPEPLRAKNRRTIRILSLILAGLVLFAVAYILIANKTDKTEKSHNQGKYFAYIRVTDEDIKPTENANPVKTLRIRYDAWKKAGSKAFSSVPTISVSSSN